MPGGSPQLRNWLRQQMKGFHSRELCHFSVTGAVGLRGRQAWRLGKAMQFIQISLELSVMAVSRDGLTLNKEVRCFVTVMKLICLMSGLC